MLNVGFLSRKRSANHQANRKKEKKSDSPRNRKACHSIITALQSYYNDSVTLQVAM
jgi:hypothetical protein